MIFLGLCFGLLFVGIDRSNAWLFPKSVDCGETGVFKIDVAPFSDHWWPLPKCPSVIPPVYKVYTRSNPLSGQTINYNTWAIPSVFAGSKRTVFLAHGYTDDGDADWVRDLVAKLLAKEDFNVIVIDWREGAKLGPLWNLYNPAAANTRTMGAQTALVMKRLVDNAGAAWERLWCVGHSLGAHVCGSAGMEASKRGGVLGRVTGLDPAGPAFQGASDIRVGINPSSAAFVDIIHTTTTFGMLKKLGHMDFYPSDGQSQNGCLEAVCGHMRPIKYFEESIATDCFFARETCTDPTDIPASCTNQGNVVARMGFSAKGSGADGLYRLDINSNSPYCKG